MTGTKRPPMARAKTRSSARVPNNLPVQLTSFVGRVAELEAVGDLIARARLITLTGPGGAGKSRLACQAAAGGADAYRDGVWWVDLAGSADGASVAKAMASVLGALIDGANPVSSLAAQIADRKALLCLDNAEHVLDAVAGIADAVLRDCPDITLLATSREPLGLAGEVVWRVPPLLDDDAVRLFVERGSLVQPQFTLDGSNEPAVRSIVSHLDGIPLALELAAAWLGTLSPRQIEIALDERFKLLVRGPRGAQRRQQTLWGSIDWSHALLNDIERTVFRRLAVCPHEFSLELGLAVGAGPPIALDDVLPVLGRLVDKSLVVAEDRAGETRYRLLETIRAYAMARLGEAKEEATVRDRHLAWCLEFAEAIDADREREPDRWRGALRSEYDDLLAALDWGLAADDPLDGRRLAAALGWLWHLDARGREGMDYLRLAIARAADDRSPLQARLVTALALVADTASPLDLEYDAATWALELATEVGDDGLRALCLNLAAVGAFYTDFDAAWTLCEDAYHAAEIGNNRFVLGGARALQAIILHLRDRHAEAEALIDGTVWRNLQLHRGVLSAVLGSQASGALATGDPAGALERATEAVRLAEPLGDYLRVGAARSTLAYVSALAGDMDGAIDSVEPILRLLEGAQEEAFVPGIGHTMGVLAMRRADPETAIHWFEREARSTDRGIATYLAGNALPGLGASLTAVGRREEAAEVLEHAVDVATRLGMPHALAEALDAQAELSAADLDGLESAIDLDHEALTLRAKHGLRAFVPDSLEALARHGSAIRPRVDDVLHLAASESARRSMGVPRAPQGQSAFEAVVAHLRERLGDGTFDQSWTDGTGLSLDDAVAHARRGRGVRGRPSIGWASLTPTELDVVRLVIEGLNNPEIAARLFISRSTVKTHLAHIFAKIGVGNRTELASLAMGRIDRQSTALTDPTAPPMASR